MTKFYSVKVNGNVYEVEVEEIAQGSAPEIPTAPTFAPPAPKAAPAPKAPPKPAAPAGGTTVTAPMQGTILKIEVSNGQAVKKGDLICLLEAMKMENEIFAPCDGTVTVIASKGQTVATGEAIASIA